MKRYRPCVLALATASLAFGQIHVDREVVGCGGEAGASASYQLTATVGQGAIGVITGASAIHEIGFWFQPPDPMTAVDDDIVVPDVPREHALDQNHPNPFNPLTTIEYAIPASSHVSVRIYDLTGREVRCLVDQDLAAGYHKVSFIGEDLASGVYVCRMVAGSFVQTRKVTLLK